MQTRLRPWTWLWLSCAMAMVAGLVSAQAPKPAAPGPQKVKPEAPPADAAPAAPHPQAEENPLVRAVLQSQPSTPLEQVQAAHLLAKLERAELARGFLGRVLGAGLARDALADLADQLGGDVLVQLGTREDLAPEAQRLVREVIEAQRQRASDPQHIAAAIAGLADSSPAARVRAMVELRRARGAAVGPLVALLADPARAAEHPAAQSAFREIGADAREPLAALLDSEKPAVTVQALRALGAMQGPEVYLELLGSFARADRPAEVREAAREALTRHVGSLPSAAQAARLLAEHARRWFDERIVLRPDPAGDVVVWSWDEAEQRLTERTLPVALASLRMAARRARDAHFSAPEDAEIRALYLATLLEYAAHLNGLDRPLPTGPDTLAGKIARFDAETLQGVLVVAMEGDHGASAAAVARLLGEKPEAVRLLTRSGSAAPLVRATRHSDRRLRLAALEAIVRLRPEGPFPGASWVLEGLEFLAGAGGSPRALVAVPRLQDYQRVARYVGGLGYVVQPAMSGADLLHEAFSSPDYELILVDAGINRPTLDFLLQQIRRDGRTELLPVGILARADSLDEARRVARHHARVEAFAYPHEEADAKWQLERVAKLAAPHAPAAAVREVQAARALALFPALADSLTGRSLDLRRIESTVLRALYRNALNPAATVTLGRLGTPAAQQALVELASRSEASLPVRQAAARAFQQAVLSRGLMLSTAQIRLQYDRYNRSADADAGTQQVLGLLLDSIELPTQSGRQAARAVLESAPQMAHWNR